MTKLKFPGSGCSGCNQNSFSDTLEIQDEGDSLGTASILNFVGEGVTATKVGGKATITINGGGGSSAMTDWPIASGAPTGTIAAGKRYYLTGPPGVILGEAVAEGTTMEARINNPTVRADWYFNMAGT